MHRLPPSQLQILIEYLILPRFLILRRWEMENDESKMTNKSFFPLITHDHPTTPRL
jgi:hypothetical protein